MEVVIPLLMANLIDFGIDDGNLEYIVKMGVVLVVFALISLIFGILSGRSAAIAQLVLRKIFVRICITRFKIFLFQI